MLKKSGKVRHILGRERRMSNYDSQLLDDYLGRREGWTGQKEGKGRNIRGRRKGKESEIKEGGIDKKRTGKVAITYQFLMLGRKLSWKTIHFDQLYSTKQTFCDENRLMWKCSIHRSQYTLWCLILILKCTVYSCIHRVQHKLYCVLYHSNSAVYSVQKN